jgi:hypothetical protein
LYPQPAAVMKPQYVPSFRVMQFMATTPPFFV